MLSGATLRPVQVLQRSGGTMSRCARAEARTTNDTNTDGARGHDAGRERCLPIRNRRGIAARHVAGETCDKTVELQKIPFSGALALVSGGRVVFVVAPSPSAPACP
jgi:hypothetical protein